MTTDTLGAREALLRRWLTALGLLASAEEYALRGDDASASAALIVGDTACEAIVGLLGTRSSLALKPEPKYHELLERAVDASAIAGLPLDADLLADLRASHATRNAVVHLGATGTAAQAAVACRSARRLLDALPALSETFGALPAGATVVGGIASLLEAPELAEQLLAGELALREGRAADAADAATRAHSELLLRLDPPIGRDHPGRLSPFEGRELGKLRKYVEELGTSLADLQGWVAASAMGMSPVAYRRLRRTLGTHVRYVGGNDSIRRGHGPTLEEARGALITVAEMAFRLWQLGGLIEGTREEVIRSRYGLPPPDGR